MLVPKVTPIITLSKPAVDETKLQRYPGAFLLIAVSDCSQDKDEPEWRPLFALPLTSPSSGELACAKLSFCFHPDGTPLPTFYVGSTDGELVQADWSKEAVRIHLLLVPSA